MANNIDPMSLTLGSCVSAKVTVFPFCRETWDGPGEEKESAAEAMWASDAYDEFGKRVVFRGEKNARKVRTEMKGR